ncbi:MAG: DUF5666 domain-containing protein, partial [Gammaproteobacteria bacterium]
MSARLLLACHTCLAALLLSACGGGGISATFNGPPGPFVPPAPEPEAVSSLGVISALGSVRVNGVTYESGAAAVTANGQLGSLADLAPGELVLVEGMIDGAEATGTADAIHQEATVIGPLESLEAHSGRLVVMGQPVLIDSDTVLGPGIDPAGLAGLQVGSIVELSGFSGAAGPLLATRIELVDNSGGVQLVGAVTGLDTVNRLFKIDRLIVDYGDADVVGLPGGMPTEGTLIVIRGSLVDDVLVAEHIGRALVARFLGAPGQRTHAAGAITRFQSPADFDLNGVRTTTHANTVFAGGTVDDLVAGAQIAVDGEVASGGQSLLAQVVTIGTSLEETSTVTFDFADFTEIFVSSVFNVVVIRDPEFSVEVTIDTDVLDNLQITQSGTALLMGLEMANNNVSTLDAVVRLPVLDRIDVSGVANVTLRGFDQLQLRATVAGVSTVRGQSMMLSSLVADVGGVSELDFREIRPAAEVAITVSDASRATLNMDVRSTLSGFVSSGAALYYYGTDVTTDVTTSAGATFVRLG